MLRDAVYADPHFLEANAQCIEATSGFRRRSWPSGVPVLFTAHSRVVLWGEEVSDDPFAVEPPPVDWDVG